MSDIEIHLFQKRKYNLVFLCFFLAFLLLTGRLIYLTVFRSEELSKRALSIEQRERTIKAARGKVYDRNGIVLADNQAVCSVSVIYYQIKEPEKVIRLLSQKLAISEKEVRKKVEKISSREKIKSNVPKAIADEIREAGLSGVKVDEDYKRYYPFGTLASKVLGFAGADNQGILGLESRYDSTLKGTDGKILTMTDYQGIEVENLAEDRIEPVSGDDLYLSLDYNIQCYVQQAAKKVLKAKKAKRVSAILMNPQNGEIYALVSLPEYDLNEPFTLIEEYKEQGKTQNDKLNNMWRNPVISDSYEPGSTFKIVTATAALEEKKVTLQDSFFCSGFKLVEDRKIRCHKTQGHGAETFQQGFMNSCNPVFMEIGARVGAKDMLKYYQKLGLYERTGVDLPGEANSIMHKLSKIGAVELATMSFGQSIQITPLQLLRAVSAGINGGKLVTPHLAMEKKDSITKEIIQYEYPIKPGAVSEETSQTLRELLEAVVAEGTGKNGQVEGYRVGGKTATSEKLPRRSGKYISSFLGFAPADSPKILGLVLIDEVEMHLHPLWQQTVLLDLQKTFPMVQFVVTTHSAQVLSSVPAESIRVLAWGKQFEGVRHVDFSLGANSYQLLQDIQNVSPRQQSLPIVQDLKRYLQLVSEDAWDTPEALELRKKLDKWSKGKEPALMRADMDIRMRQFRRRRS